MQKKLLAQVGDATLQSNIDSETTARANADTTLQNNIDAEETARIDWRCKPTVADHCRSYSCNGYRDGLRTDVDANTQGVADNASAISVETARALARSS